MLRRSGDTMGKLVSHELELPEIEPFLNGAGGAGAMKVQYRAV